MFPNKDTDQGIWYYIGIRISGWLNHVNPPLLMLNPRFLNVRGKVLVLSRCCHSAVATAAPSNASNRPANTQRHHLKPIQNVCLNICVYIYIHIRLIKRFCTIVIIVNNIVCILYMYISFYICISWCVYIYIYIYICAYWYKYNYAYIYTNTYVHVSLYIYIYIYIRINHCKYHLIYTHTQ